MPTLHNYLYHHEKAEEFDTDQTNPDIRPREGIWGDRPNQSPEKQFKIKVITMLMELQRNMQELRDDVRKELTEMKQSLEGFISRMDKMQEAIDGIETRKQECLEADTEIKKSPGMNQY